MDFIQEELSMRVKEFFKKIYIITFNFLEKLNAIIYKCCYGFISFVEICMEIFPIKLILVSSVFINIILIIGFFFYDFNNYSIIMSTFKESGLLEFEVFSSVLNKSFLILNQFFFYIFFFIHCFLGFLNFLYDYFYKNLKLNRKNEFLNFFFLTFGLLFIVLSFFV